MTPPREWLRPPRSLLTILFLVTLVSVSALGWFGWKLLDQERVLEAQRARERVEQSADRITAIARGSLAETGERLGGWLIAPPAEGKPEDGLLLVVRDDGGEPTLTAAPAHRLLYRPAPAFQLPPLTSTFADGELLEFQQALPDRALDIYKRLTDSKLTEVRAGAFLRVGRILRKLGRNDEARAAYLKLASYDISLEGLPAALIARHALAEFPGHQADADILQASLREARWPLARGQFAYYWSEAARLSGHPGELPMSAIALSDAVAESWNVISQEASPRGLRTVWIDRHPWLLIWRSTPGRRAVFVTRPETVLRQVLADADVMTAAVDSEGRLVAGHRSTQGHAVIRTTAETQLPWTLWLTDAQAASDAGMLARQRFLLLITALMVLFLIGGAYFIARAIRGDLAIARMQSDFVSAVSHEFRSPLTSIRQLSEILALGRIPNESRRAVYYETLVRETARLQRLVEGLLNFGRMEAGVRQYRFEPVETATLVARVAAEFEPQMTASGRSLVLDGETNRCTIDADPEALSVALRNLVDNALKYAPDCPSICVNWQREDSQVAIRVRDSGPGVPASERRAIFRKFVRGSAAESANVRGSGVGLAMVRHIVVAHGGAVTLASEPGQGSVFTILLPLGGKRK